MREMRARRSGTTNWTFSPEGPTETKVIRRYSSKHESPENEIPRVPTWTCQRRSSRTGDPLFPSRGIRESRRSGGIG